MPMSPLDHIFSIDLINDHQPSKNFQLWHTSTLPKTFENYFSGQPLEKEFTVAGRRVCTTI
jgi:hypothetical protein